MERLAAPSHLHDSTSAQPHYHHHQQLHHIHHHQPQQSTTSQSTPKWGSATLPHNTTYRLSGAALSVAPSQASSQQQQQPHHHQHFHHHLSSSAPSTSTSVTSTTSQQSNAPFHHHNITHQASSAAAAAPPPPQSYQYQSQLQQQQQYSSYLQQQQQQQQATAAGHARSRSNSGREVLLLNTSTDSALSWRSAASTANTQSGVVGNAASAAALGPSSNNSTAAALHYPSHLQQQNTSGLGYNSGLLSQQQQQNYNNNSSSASAGQLNNSFSSTNSSSNNILNTSFGGGGSAGLGARSNAVMEQHKKDWKQSEWFHGHISRQEAEERLQPREDGLFLVRESTNFPGDYTLCVCCQDKVEHYRVFSRDKKYTIDDEEFFIDLDKLIDHYLKDADGLCTQLVRPMPQTHTVECIKQEFKDNGWVIKKEELKTYDSIGKGEFGDVMLGDYLGTKVAVKRLKDSSKAAQHLLNEASLMTSLCHDNLVKLIGLVFEESSILLVTEYMSKGSLVDYLRSRGRLHVTKRDQIMFACDTAAGMEYLENNKVVHRDLAARNVLISHDSVAKVCDFGLAATTDGKQDHGKVPIKWTAPEALKLNQFSSKSDMWSFGILLWEIYSFGRVPYPKIPLADVMKHVEKGYRMDAPDNCPAEVFKLMEEAWFVNPDKRPSFQQVHIRLQEIKRATPA